MRLHLLLSRLASSTHSRDSDRLFCTYEHVVEAVLHLIRNLESQVKVIEQLSECSYERGIEHSGYLISSYFTTLKECCELLRQSWYAK